VRRGFYEPVSDASLYTTVAGLLIAIGVIGMLIVLPMIVQP
jgi:preprotein translocase subunit Sss1